MKETNTEIDRQTLRIFWQAMMHNKTMFWKSLLYIISKLLIGIAIPLMISLIFAKMVQGSQDINVYLFVLAGVAALGVLTNLVGILALLALNAKVQYDLLELSMKTLLKRSVGFHTNNIGGRLVNNALEYPQAYGRLQESLYLNLAPFLLILITGILVVIFQSLVMGLALSVVCGVTIILAVIETRQRTPLRYTRRKVQNRMVANLSDTIVNAQAVKTFASEDRELSSHNKFSEDLLDFRYRHWASAGRSGTWRMAWLLFLQIGLIAFIFHLYTRDPSVLGAGIFAFVYTIMLTNRLFEITNLMRTTEEALLDASSMTKHILEDVEISDAPDARELKVKKGAIKLDAVNFSYDDNAAEEVIFENLSLDIPAGQKLGLVGPSGGGKSTLTRLLLRFEDVLQGAITIDGQDLRAVTQASLRSNIAYVPQEPLLFHRSIFENIAYGKPDATEQEVKQAAKQAYADGFIEKLSNQYETIVGERGVKLSGGQRQRIAIARAILKDSPILILDEATSSLDSESEVYIQKALEKLMKGRTTIIIAHRLSTIQKMDRIIVLDEGRIVEQGTHTELVKQQGIYSMLWKHQSGGFLKD